MNSGIDRLMNVFSQGFLLGFSLILAIGAQNAFVLRQGIRNSHIVAIVLTCAISDALLIAAGVAGFGALAERFPWIEPVFLWGGVLFLTAYGVLSLKRAWEGGHAMPGEGETTESLAVAILTCLGFTWLNPHVYLDTLVLLGSVAATKGDQRWVFGYGAMAASIVFFASLGGLARALAPVFQTPQAWRWLDTLVGVVMLALALGLALSH